MIAWVTTNNTVAGGTLVPFEYVSRLKKLGIESDIFAEDGNQEIEAFYGFKVRPLSQLQTTKDDVIIAIRWEQCEALSALPGKKFQFVQGDDLVLLGDNSTGKECAKWRNNLEWELIGVSRFVLMRWGRGEVIPNGLNERFFTQLPVSRDIDILIEGNNEPNKNISEAIALAKQVKSILPDIKIVWLGRETDDRLGVECITNPKQEDIPAIYQRSKVMIKLSKSEGFCLPILEAMASGCLVVTTNMGGNDDWCVHEYNCIMENYAPEIIEHLKNGKHTWVVERGRMKAKEFDWRKSVNKLLYVTGGNR